jgi:hypothetical protein
MKKYLLLTVSFIILFQLSHLTAQVEGSARFEVTDVKSNNPQASQQLSGSTVLIQTQNGVVKSISSMMNNAVQMQRITNLNNQGAQIYLDLMGKKVYVSVTDSIQNIRLKERAENTNISYDPGTTKVINGYTCYKAVVETLREDGSVREFHLFITEELKLPAFAISGLPATLRGFPLEYTIKTGTTEILYSLKELSASVAADFQQTPVDYPEMPFAEFEAGLGKKLGF